jgi:RNA polymerase sigma-70 factor (ECF subfamily)
MEREEREWITRARAGDARAMKALYDAHAPKVYALLRRMAGDDALAEDWAQEAWIRAFRSLHRFRGDARFSTWLHRIAVNAAMTGYRQARRMELHEEALEPRRSVESADSIVLRVRLERALAAVPTGMRRVLVLHDVHGYTHEDIGAMLGISDGTSKSQLFRARAKLRTLLHEERGSAGGASEELHASGPPRRKRVA